MFDYYFYKIFLLYSWFWLLFFFVVFLTGSTFLATLFGVETGDISTTLFKAGDDAEFLLKIFINTNNVLVEID